MAVDGVACVKPAGAADVVVSFNTAVCVAPSKPYSATPVNGTVTVSVSSSGGDHVSHACGGDGTGASGAGDSSSSSSSSSSSICTVTYDSTLTPTIKSVSTKELPAGVSAMNLTVKGFNLLAPGANYSRPETWGVTAGGDTTTPSTHPTAM